MHPTLLTRLIALGMVAFTRRRAGFRSWVSSIEAKGLDDSCNTIQWILPSFIQGKMDQNKGARLLSALFPGPAQLPVAASTVSDEKLDGSLGTRLFYLVLRAN